MKTTKTRFCAGAITLALANSVSILQAQTSPSASAITDNPPNAGIPNVGPPHGYYEPLNGRLYMGFDAGVALLQDVTISDSLGYSEKVTFDPGIRLDMMVGYQFTKNWAAEIEFGIIANQVKHSYILGTDYTTINYLQLPILVNGIYTLPLNKSKSCSVYFGAGFGGVFSQYSDEYGDQTPGDTVFAYQGMAGFRWAINRQWEVGLGYKFLGTTESDVGSGVVYDGYTCTETEFKSDGTRTHSILATLTYRF